MENIADKIKTLNYSEEMMATLPKFLGTLVAKNPETGEDIVSKEDLEKSLKFLKVKGISIRPAHLKVLANGFSYIKNAVEEMEKIGELKMYIDDPTRMTSKDNVNRILYLRANEIEYVSEEGKYSKLAYSKRAFESEFGTIDFEAEKSKKTKEGFLAKLKGFEKNNSAKNEMIEKKESQNSPVLEEPKDEKIVIKDSNSSKEVKHISPIKHDLDRIEKNVDKGPSSITKQDGVEYTGALDLAGLEESFNTPSTKSERNTANLSNKKESDVNYNAILSKPQSSALNDETFERFEKLSDSVRRVLTTVYNITEINESITDNLVKLITAGVTSDSDIIYNAITYGKNITEDEAQQLKSSIEEELEYIKIFDFDTESQGRGKAA